MWKTIPSFPQYEASDCGDVRSIKTGKLLTRRIDPAGYHVVTVMKPKREGVARKNSFTPARVNRLVCEAFHGPQPEGQPHAAHENGIRHDNREENLRWASVVENHEDRERHGTVLRGEQTYNARLTEQTVRLAKALRNDGRSWSETAARCGASIRAVRNAVAGKSWLVAVAAAVAVAACTTAPSDVTCPSLPAYSPELQTKAADELDAMPEDSVIAGVFMPDYGKMRAGVRECIKARGK